MDPIDQAAQKGRRHDCLRSAVSLLGFGSIFVIGAIAGFNLKSSAGPPVQLEASSTKTVDLIPAQLTGALNLMPARSLSGAINTEVLDWRDVNNCQLMALGKEYDDDKFYEHTFGDIYCETLIPFRSSRSKLRMLEVGFGCGHHNHGRSAQVWKRYFTENNGPGVALYEVDYGPDPKQTACVDDFLKEHPNVCDGIFLGDQSNKTFMSEVVKKSGGRFDIIIDDGGHLYNQQKSTFEVLWKTLSPGGLYYIEDLHVSSSQDGMTREILGWADQLASCRQPFCGSVGTHNRDKPKWVKWPTQAPKDMISVHCQSEICVMRKMYSKRAK